LPFENSWVAGLLWRGDGVAKGNPNGGTATCSPAGWHHLDQ
jgi:hypothetical protein